MTAVPASWDAMPLRACNVCSFGRDAKGMPTRPGGADAATCICPGVTGRGLPLNEATGNWPIGVPVGPARDNYGPCGPEAHCQAFPGF